jgi:hypothetical protein
MLCAIASRRRLVGPSRPGFRRHSGTEESPCQTLVPHSISKNTVSFILGVMLLFYFALYFNDTCFCTEIDANSVESWADNILGAKSVTP